MSIPLDPVYFEPQKQTGFYAAHGALFLVDPARVSELLPDAEGGDLIRTLTRKAHPHELYRQGAIVPALGVEEGDYIVDVRSTATEDVRLPLSHMVFSAGFVLGTETGQLLLCNTRRLQHWTPGVSSGGRDDYPLESLERRITIGPGWYSVTIVRGILEDDGGRDEAWACAFLLDPQPSQPRFHGDLHKTLSF